MENKSTSISFEERFQRQRELTTSPIISDHGKIVTNALPWTLPLIERKKNQRKPFQLYGMSTSMACR